MLDLNKLDELASLDMAKLREIWATFECREDPPAVKSLLVRDIAWRAQAARTDDIGTETKRLLKAAVRAVSAPSRATKPTTTQFTLPTGSELIRKWNGMDYRVIVRDEGRSFELNGTRFSSLSAVAKEITGAHWSGPRFFGLNRKRIGK